MLGMMGPVWLAFVADLYEDLELWYPRIRLEEAGRKMVVAGPALEVFAGKHGYPARADALINSVSSEAFEGLLIPGGFMPDRLRRDPMVLTLTRKFHEEGKPIAFICHGGWIPVSANILRGRHATGSLGIKDDLENAGALWTDQAVVVDGNLISSRTPADLAAFGAALVSALPQGPSLRPNPR